LEGEVLETQKKYKINILYTDRRSLVNKIYYNGRKEKFYVEKNRSGLQYSKRSENINPGISSQRTKKDGHTQKVKLISELLKM
jgi:hypothetical protein